MIICVSVPITCCFFSRTPGQAMQSAAAQLIVVCKNNVFDLHWQNPPQLLAPTIDSNQTNVGGSRPRCWDEAPAQRWGVAAPLAKQSAAVQLIVVCKKIDLIFFGRYLTITCPHSQFRPNRT